jgi:hypothetical protein
VDKWGVNVLLSRGMCHFPAGIGKRGLSQTAKKTALIVVGSEGKVKSRQKQPKRGDQILWDHGFGLLFGLTLPLSVKIVASPAVQESFLEADRDHGVERGRLARTISALEGRKLPPAAAGTHENERGDGCERYPDSAFRQR